MLGRLVVRDPEVPVIFAGSRRFAEEWAYRFFSASVSDQGNLVEGAFPGSRPALRPTIRHSRRLESPGDQ